MSSTDHIKASAKSFATSAGRSQLADADLPPSDTQAAGTTLWKWPGVTAVLLSAAALRIAWALLVPVMPVSDSVFYDKSAINLAQHGVFGWTAHEPTAYWPPGTSFVIAVLYSSVGISYAAVVVLNILCSLALIMLTMSLTRSIFGPRAGMAAGWLLAFWPVHIQFTTILASELLFTALFLATMAAWQRAQSSSWWAIATGCIAAFCSYVRPTGLLIIAVLGAIDVAVGPRRRWTVVAGLSAAMAMVVLIAPWTLRNYVLFQRVVPISTNGGSNLWMGNNPTTTGLYQPPPVWPELNEAELDAERGRIARAYIMKAPEKFIGRTIVKFVRFHERQTIGVHWNVKGLVQAFGEPTTAMIKAGSQIYWMAALCCAIVGVGLWCRQVGVIGATVNPMLCMWMYLAWTHAVIVVQDRYAIPVTPMVAAFAGYGLVECRHRWFARRG